MKVRDDHLVALAACVDEGTFDGAAAALRISPSAVSQRVKALEQAVGQVVLVRSVPVRPTGVGRVLLRSARRRALLDAELEGDLAASGVASGGGVLDLPVAVNADSLATWFLEVFETVAQWGDVRLRVFVEDQDHSAHLLRDGSVVGAVTASAAAVQGCSVLPLGVMRYVPRVRSDLWARHDGDLARVPTVRFNDRDDLQRRVLRARGVREPAVEHVVPSAEGFSAAIHAGLGWGMVPEGLEAVPAVLAPSARERLLRPAEGGGEAQHAAARSPRAAEALMRVPGLDVLDVPLFWQCWRLGSPSLDRLTDEVTSAAHRLR